MLRCEVDFLFANRDPCITGIDRILAVWQTPVAQGFLFLNKWRLVMGKPRAQTIQQRFGFLDSDLTTSTHDTIMFWLDANMEQIVVSLMGKLHLPTEWEQEEIKCGLKLIERANATQFSYVHDIVAEPIPPFPGIKIGCKRWEVPITQEKSNFIVGFIDMQVSISEPSLHLKYLWGQDSYWKKGEPASGEWSISYQDNYRPLYFEVKTSIPSIGELLRQVRMYQTYTSGKFFVVAPDDKFESILSEQGIGFVKYPLTKK